MRRAVQALTRRILPGRAGQVVELALGAKVAIAALPVLLVVLFILTALIAVVGAVGGGASGAAGAECEAGKAAPMALQGPPKYLIPIYQAASNAEGLNPDGPAILAGINRVETDFGQDLGPSSAGAIGWMQFEPSTWAEYGDGGDPDNPHDAIFAAARLLKADGAPGNWYQAIFGYNHAAWYVEEVEGYAHEYASDLPANVLAGGELGSRGVAPESAGAGPECGHESGGTSTVPGERARLLANGLAAAPADAPQQVKTMIAAGNQIAELPYVWGGHHALGSPTNGYDCSSAVSYVLYAGGLLPSGTAGFDNNDFYTSFLAENFVAGGPIGGLREGAGKWVTLFSSGEHTYMTIAGLRFDDSSSELRNGMGPHGTNVSMWQPLIDLPGFTEAHPAGL